jgi:TonB family protein
MDKLHYDIEKYLKGELSPSEMHALEKRALDDPFLADALEGSSGVDSNVFASDLKELRGKIKLQTKPTISLWAWAGRIAAGIVFLALATFLIINLSTKENKKDKLSVNQPPPKQAEKQQQAPPLVADSATKEKKSSPAQTPSKELNKTFAEKAQRSAEQPAEVQGQTMNDEKSAVAEDLAEEQERIVPESNSSAPAASGSIAAPERKKTKNKQLINGHVIDSEDGKGLPGVNVTIRGTNIGTITDEEGRYQLAMDSLGTGLLFSFIGFETKEVVPGSTNLDVTLVPDIAQLSEIVVVGYGADKGPEEAPVIEMASPVGGRKAFKQYLEQNLRYPEQALNNKVEGKVTVQFTIESNGRVGEFQVLRGIGYGCDDEVIRLIKEGPSWVPTKRDQQAVRDKVKVRLRFALPKKQ